MAPDAMVAFEDEPKAKEDEHHELDAHDSTLCEFEHFWKPYVDFGLGVFSLVTRTLTLTSLPPRPPHPT